MALPSFIPPVLEELSNRLLRLDGTTLRRLGALDGEVIHLQFTQPVADLYLFPSESGLRMLAHYVGTPAVTLTGTFAAFVKLGLNTRGHTTTAFFSGAIAISGNVELGQRFQRILAQIEIDWEEQAARVLGDVVAHQLGNWVRGGMNLGREVIVSLSRNTKEYLQEEARMLVSRAQLEIFLTDVDKLRADVDRLAQRIQLLQAQR